MPLGCFMVILKLVQKLRESFILVTSIKWILVGSVVTSVSFATTSLSDIIFVKHVLPKTEIQHIDKKNQISKVSTSLVVGKDFRFKAMNTIASSHTDSYSNSQMRFTWDSAKTVLTLNGTSVNSANNRNTWTH